MTTIAFLLLVLVPILAWEAYAVVSGEVVTISQAHMIVADLSEVLVAAGGILVGHFFVQPPARYAPSATWPEATEVAVLAWLLWALFIALEAYPRPLPWWGDLLLIFVSATLGAFFWTQGV